MNLNNFSSYLFGVYDLCSSDLNVLRQVLVKDFNCFTDRQNVLPADPENKHSLMQNMLSVKEGEGWRRVRNLMTPAFTTGKLKLVRKDYLLITN
jgi:cytochrome P450